MTALVPTVVAVLHPIASVLNHRLPRPFPSGWLETVLGLGLHTQAVLSGGYLMPLNPAYRSRFLAEVIFIPQPFVAGAMVCWYHGFPLWLSLLGGFIVLGIASALVSDSLVF